MNTLTNEMSFQEKYERAVIKNNSLLCIGLDTEYEKLPMAIKVKEFPIFEFNKTIIDETVKHVCAYKLNVAFYEAEGDQGILQLKKSCDYLKNTYSDIPIILDAKKGDIEHTNQATIRYAYDYLGVDAITLHPYLGKASLAPFLNIPNKGNFIVCRTSNPGAGELQELTVGQTPTLLYQTIATKVASEWNQNGNCMLILGSPFPQEITEIRKVVGPNILILLPGIGSQEIDLQKAVQAGINSKKTGIIVHAARSIIYASQDSNFFIKAREAAIKLKEEINKYRTAEPIKAEEVPQDISQSVVQQDQKITPSQNVPTNLPQAKPLDSQPSDLTE